MIKLKQEIKKEFNTQLNKNEYKIVLTGYELNGIHIPLDPNNRYYKKVQELISKGEVPEPQYTEANLNPYIQKELLNELNSLCDTKSKEAENYIAGMRVSDKQLQRYIDKYNIVIKYLADTSNTDLKASVTLAADLAGSSVDDYCNLIKEKHDQYISALETLNNKIDAFRVKVKQLILNNEFDKVEGILEKAKNFNANTTDDEIKALFN